MANYKRNLKVGGTTVTAITYNGTAITRVIYRDAVGSDTEVYCYTCSSGTNCTTCSSSSSSTGGSGGGCNKTTCIASFGQCSIESGGGTCFEYGASYIPIM